MESVNYHHKIIIVKSRSNSIRIHMMLCREVLMAIGYSLDTAQKITRKIFVHFFKGQESVDEILVTREAFNDKLGEIHAKNKLETVKRLHNYYFAIIKLRMKQQGVIILIGGASGSGKSSLTSLLAGRLHLKEMSSDNIRHIMRNFISKSESPFIFSSTYDSDHLIKDPHMTLEEKCIEAYLRQCRCIQVELKKVLDIYYKSGVWVIVEGVHITPEFIIDCMKTFNNCFGCIVHVEDAEKYKNRFASRSSKNSIKPEDNKYIQGFEKILMIQKYLITQAEEKLIPKIHNTNLDTSYCLIHRSFLKNFKLITKEQGLIDATADNASLFYEEFLKTKASLNKAKKIREYIKMGKVEMEENRGLDSVKRPSVSDKDADGSLTLARVKDLAPLSKDSRSSMVILPKLPGDKVIKAVVGFIKKIEAADSVKVHWVTTDKRTIIFKTEASQMDDINISDFILEKNEVIQNVVTDSASKEKLFAKALEPVYTRKPTSEAKSKKKPNKAPQDSDASFESIKKDKKRKPSAHDPKDFSALQMQAADIDNGNQLDNSIDKMDSDNDSQHKEVTWRDADL